jgi:hypothetical protein
MDPGRKLFFHRKALAVVRWDKEAGYRNLVGVPDDIDRVVNDHGIRYIIHAENGRVEFEGQQVLRDYLRMGRFTPVARTEIQGNVRGWKGQVVVLFENRFPTSPRVKSLRIPNMNLGRDIVVPTGDTR